jgi:hypothetical protein
MFHFRLASMSWLQLAGGFLIPLAAWAATSLPPAQPAIDFKAVAGTWKGPIVTRSAGSGHSTLTIREDGTWGNVIVGLSGGAPRATGTASIENGKYRWKSQTTGRSGTWTLHQDGSRRVLISEGDDGGSRSELTAE